MKSPQANESAPEIPMLAAWPAVARDIVFASTRSARSLRPVMYVPAHPTPVRARVARPDQNPSANSANNRWPATVDATPKR
jgi:hypothetical protein